MTTQVSTSVDVLYGVRVVISPGRSTALQYAVRKQVVTSGCSLLYAVRMVILQGKTVVIVYNVRKIIPKSSVISYGVRVPIASNKTFGLVYNVRKSVSNSSSIVYNTGVTGNTRVSKSVGIFFHTLIKTQGGTGGSFSTAFSNAYDSGVGVIKPTVDLVIATPTEVDPVPPQIVTASF